MAMRADGASINAQANPSEKALTEKPCVCPSGRRSVSVVGSGTDVISNSVGMKLALVPAGEFDMGSKESPEALVKAFKSNATASRKFPSEQPLHPVRITRAFYLAVNEVTVAQFRQFVGETHYKTDAESGPIDSPYSGGVGCTSDGSIVRSPRFTWRNPGFAQADSHPVVEVSWNDSVAFCEWLSRKEGKTYRLPTEAEWEYSCRAATETRYCNGDAPERLVDVGNVADRTLRDRWRASRPYLDRHATSARDGCAFTAPVRRYKPNAWGLYDMHGNASEWCSDRYAWDYYRESPRNDPAGPCFTPGEYRVFRGGSFQDTPDDTRSASRDNFPSNYAAYWIGFRVARNL
jgi:formylglycine-generating enzyme required for sulfatase activity